MYRYQYDQIKVNLKEEKEDIIIYINSYVSGWCADYWFLLF